VTTVKLHAVKQNKLVVSGLDAMNGTPVIDIKPSDTSFLAESSPAADIRKEKLKNNPRFDTIKAIKSEDYEWLLIQAGQLHGHYCPGRAMGVMAAVKALNELNAFSDGMEDVLAITETNNCFSDGIQHVTGCSFGNNALIFRDLGKTAVTLTRRNGKGFRICSTVESRDVIQEKFPDFEALFQEVIVKQNHDTSLKAQFKKAARERSFGIFELPFNELFTLEEVSADIPPYAPIFDSIICAQCGERTMLSRTISKADKTYCLSCSHQSVQMLSGDGIHVS
jgi:formylmethanofuran dehydrogenase subunit E